MRQHPGEPLPKQQLDGPCLRNTDAGGQIGWTLVDSFTEPGVSGREGNRPEFQRMLGRAYSDDHPYDVILVHSYSRFARDHVVLEVQCRKLMAEGVRVVAVT